MTEPRRGSALRRLQQLQQERGAPSPPPESASSAPEPGREPHAHGGAARKGLWGVLVVVGLALWKFKVIPLFLLGKLKFLLAGLKLLKFGKLFTTSWTMVLSMWVYSMYFGAPFAIGFVLLILVHELGHGLAARLVGLPVGAPVFIPFFGAMIALKEQPRTTFQDFIIGYGGPLAGSLGALACLAAAPAAGEHWGALLYVVAYFALIINLFNLIPLWQLDGARIAAPFRTGMWALAVGVLAAVTLGTSGAAGELNPIPLIVVLAGLYRLGHDWWQQRSARQAASRSALQQLADAGRRAAETRDVEVTTRDRWISWACYVVLASALIALVHHLHAGLPVVEG